jgi:hypothetical protein
MSEAKSIPAQPEIEKNRAHCKQQWNLQRLCPPSVERRKRDRLGFVRLTSCAAPTSVAFSQHAIRCSPLARVRFADIASAVCVTWVRLAISARTPFHKSTSVRNAWRAFHGRQQIEQHDPEPDEQKPGALIRPGFYTS